MSNKLRNSLIAVTVAIFVPAGGWVWNQYTSFRDDINLHEADATAFQDHSDRQVDGLLAQIASDQQKIQELQVRVSVMENMLKLYFLVDRVPTFAEAGEKAPEDVQRVMAQMAQALEDTGQHPLSAADLDALRAKRGLLPRYTDIRKGSFKK